MSNRFVLGLDCNATEARAALVDVEDGATRTACVPIAAPTGGPGWPAAVRNALPDLMHRLTSPADAARVAGVGVAAAPGTVCALDGTGAVLAEGPGPAPDEAARLSDLLALHDPERLARGGGRVEEDAFWAQLARLAANAPHVFPAASAFVEPGDAVVSILTGQPARSAGIAGPRALWNPDTGDIPNGVLRELNPLLNGVVGGRVPADVTAVGQRAGVLSPDIAEALDVPPDTPVAAAMPPAAACCPAAGFTGPGDTLLYLDGGIEHVTLADAAAPVRGATASHGSVLPGLTGYASGQPALHGMLRWLANNAVPPACHHAATDGGMDVLDWLEERAAAIAPGASGLLALDWWSGNRSTLRDPDLSGLVLGLTPRTRPEEAYRCLVEAAAFGTRAVLDEFASQGIAVSGLTLAGEGPGRLFPQTLADITERPVRVLESRFTAAVGSALHGAVAAGVGDFGRVQRATARLTARSYVPRDAASAIYRRLYAEYQRLYLVFGQGGNDVMHRLKAIQREVA